MQGFDSYYDMKGGDAWTWEHMALTRARPVYGPEKLCDRLRSIIHDRLIQQRDPGKVLADVAAMRGRIARQYPGDSLWSIKYQPGGLVDIEFTAQTLQLIHAHDHPGILSPNTAEALELMSWLRPAGGKRISDRLRQALSLVAAAPGGVAPDRGQGISTRTRAPARAKTDVDAVPPGRIVSTLLKEMIQQSRPPMPARFSKRLILEPAARSGR